ncbi:MAG: PDZ domain-containing protein [Planctomycetota bacterium]
MNEKLLRLVLVLVGLGTLGGFGWKMFDYIQNKDVIVRQISMAKLEGTFGADGSAAGRNGGHLKPYENYKVLQALNITGYVAPPPVLKEEEEVKVKPRISPNDILVPWIQAPSAAWIQGRTERPKDEYIPGDLIGVGSTFELDDKKGLELKLVAVRPGEVEIQVVDTGTMMVVLPGAYEVDHGRVFVRGNDTSRGGSAEVDGVAVVYVAPERTEQVEAGAYEIGSNDLRELEKMSQEEILASVPVRVARDPLSNKVRGLRIRSVPAGSVFSRLGIKADDILLEVNGQPAVDRDQLFRSVREMDTDVIEVKVERLGGVRTLTFRLPR